MAEKKTSHVQHNGLTAASWKKMVDEQVERLESFYEQAGSVEEKGIEQARTAIEESARLMKEALTWQTQILAEWRRVSLEATRRTADALGSRS